MIELALEVNRAALNHMLEGHELEMTIEGVHIVLRVSDEVVESYRQHVQLVLLQMLPMGEPKH